MKNAFLFFGLTAFLAVSCVSGLQDDDIVVYDAPVFRASIESPGNLDTKVFVDDRYRVLWNADDRVSIFNKTTYNRQYRFTGEDGANAGMFTKVPSDDFLTSNPLNYVYSVYPYNENTSISNNGEITVYLPAEQTYREDSFGLGANTMIAITEDDELMFKNLCGYFAIKLYGDNVSVSSITLRGNNNEYLAGKAAVVAQTDTAPTIQFDAANATKELTLLCPTLVTLGSTAETATSFWFVIPPTLFENGFTLTVKDNNGGIFNKKALAPMEIRRNTLKKTAALEVETQPNHVIYYTSSDGEVVTPNSSDGFGANIISNEYLDGHGIITFDGIVTHVGSYAFSRSSNLESISLPGRVTSIDPSAFKNCSNLCTVNIPESVISIGIQAFDRCSSLTTITIPSGVIIIEPSVFMGCSSLTAITIPESVTSIGTQAFSGCSSLCSINIPESVTGIGDGAFSGCSSLTTITIPSGVKRIGTSAFKGCSSLSMVTILEGVTEIGQAIFSDCTSLTSIAFPEGITNIGYSMFYGCINLTSVKLPESVTSIGIQAFDGCSSLSSINIPSGVTSISSYAFRSCHSLTRLTIPKSTTSIGGYAFYSCNGLSRITLLPKTPPSGGPGMFNSVFCPIYVYASSLNSYKTAKYWSDYASQISPLDPVPEAIDLGLSVKWASFNIGAFMPEEYGNFYAWGELEPYYSSSNPLIWKDGKEAGYDWPSYKWCLGSSETLTKYSSQPSSGYDGFVDGKNVLDLEDDAAHCLLSGSWRMPTEAEWRELINNCTSEWTTENGVNGQRFTSNKEGYTDKSIFLPAVGYRYRISLYNDIGLYWSSSIHGVGSTAAYRFFFDSKGYGMGPSVRCAGLPIRPVCP